MIITCKGKTYEAVNTEKVQKAKDKVRAAIEKLLKEAHDNNDDEMFLMILFEAKHYGEISLEYFDDTLGLEGIKKYIELKEIEGEG